MKDTYKSEVKELAISAYSATAYKEAEAADFHHIIHFSNQ